MIKVEQEGNKRTFKITCSKCKSLLTYTKDDVIEHNIGYGVGSGNYFYEDFLKCPLCEHETKATYE